MGTFPAQASAFTIEMRRYRGPIEDYPGELPSNAELHSVGLGANNEAEFPNHVIMEMESLRNRVAKLELAIAARPFGVAEYAVLPCPTVREGTDDALLQEGTDDALLARFHDTERTADKFLREDLSDAERTQDTQDHPESLFAYCMTMMTADRISLTKASLCLMFQSAIQVFLTLTLGLGVNYDLVRELVSRNQEPSLMNCLLRGDKAFYGTPYQNVLIAIVVMVCVALGLKRDDMDTSAVVYPNVGHPRSARLFALLAWLVKSIFVPVTLLLNLPLVLLTCTDGIDVILNGLAMTFIVEVDDLLYLCVLSKQQHHIYQVTARRLQQEFRCDAKTAVRRRDTFSWALFCSSLAMLLSTYFWIASFAQFSGSALLKGLFYSMYPSSGDEVYSTSYFVSICSLLFRLALQWGSWVSPPHAEETTVRNQCFNVLSSVVFSILALFGNVMLWSGMVTVYFQMVGSSAIGSDWTLWESCVLQ